MSSGRRKIYTNKTRTYYVPGIFRRTFVVLVDLNLRALSQRMPAHFAGEEMEAQMLNEVLEALVAIGLFLILRPDSPSQPSL